VVKLGIMALAAAAVLVKLVVSEAVAVVAAVVSMFVVVAEPLLFVSAGSGASAGRRC
jgi:hypothetical protein